MPRGNALRPEHKLFKGLILGDAKAGKTEWALKAAEAGFNVLYFDGDVAGQTMQAVAPAAQERIFYMDCADRLSGGLEPRMIELASEFFTTTRLLWNDTHQKIYSPAKDSKNEDGNATDEIWEIRPSRLDHNWVFVLDSWTTLSYSAMVAKAIDSGIDLGDIEKAERSLYQGTGNRLTNMLATIQKMQCHVVVIGHPRQYEKRKSPEGVAVRNAKENDQIIEWTKMVPVSSSNPHALTMGKYFSDIGWIDVDKFGKRKLNFDITNERISGGHLQGKGDPRADFNFAGVLKAIGADVPGPDGAPMGEALVIHPPGTYTPAAAKPALALGAKKPAASPASESLAPDAKPAMVKGLGGLTNLRK
jgi:hypothetical protein